MRKTKLILLSTTLLTGFAFNASAADKWAPQVELEGKAGTSGRKLGVTKMMAPLWQDDQSLLFSDIRYKFDNQDSQEFNIGVGYRQKLNNDLILGGYGFYDRMRSDAEFMYSQGTLGIEALTENNDLRANVYIPETTKNISLGTAKLVLGNTLSVHGGFERALPGADFEIGQKIPTDGVGDLRIYGGGYSFSADDFQSVAGPRGRMELKLSEADIPEMPLGATLTFGAELQRDDVRGTEGFGLVKLTVPLWEPEEKSSLSALDKRMTNFIQRDVDIVNSNGGTEAALVNNIATNSLVQMDKYVIIDSSQEFNDVVNNADENTLIIVNGDLGDISSGAGTAVMKPGQLIIGAGTLYVMGSKSGYYFDQVFSDNRPTVDATGNGADLIQLANATAVQGIEISNPTGNGIYGTNIEDSAVYYNSIVNAGNYGIKFDGSGSSDYITIANNDISSSVSDGLKVDSAVVRALGNTISNSGGDGIEISNASVAEIAGDITNSSGYGIKITNSGYADIYNTDINGTGIDGIFVQNSDNVSNYSVSVENTTGDGISFNHVTDVIMYGVSVTNSGDNGINLYNGVSGVTANTLAIDSIVNWGIVIDDSSSIEIDDADISNTGDDAIKVMSGSSDIQISNVDIDTTGSDGIALDDSEDISISDISINNTFDGGIDIENIDNATVSGATITNTGWAGIEVHGDSDTVDISDTDISDADDDGIAIYGTVTNVSISDTSITDSGDDGIDIDDTPGIVSINTVDINNAGSHAFEMDNSTVSNLSGSGNTVSGTITGGNCSTTAATITGSVTFNTSSTCP